VSRRPVILIGGGEHARVVADAIRSNPDLFDLIGFVDPKPPPGVGPPIPAPHLGDEAALRGYPGALAVLAFASSRHRSARREAVGRLSPIVGGWATVVHRHARVAPDAVIGEGAVVLEGAVVQVGARIGAHAVVNAMAFVGHDVVVGEYALVSPGVLLGGGALVGDSAFLGLGAVIRDHRTVGTDSFVGMGVIVTSDVASGARVIPHVVDSSGRPEWKRS